MRLTDLDCERTFALLGPGFSLAGDHLLITDLISVSSHPKLVYVPYEGTASTALLFDGTSQRLANVELDAESVSIDADLACAGYEQTVERIRDSIAAGDVYEVCLTARAKLPKVSGPQLVATLCRRGVPKFFAWVRLPDGSELVSASPELLFAIEGRTVRTEPMKGTARRGAERELETSAKERAELAMITDLLRNDLTPVCKPRSVRVVNARRFIRLPYAIQAVSDVAGELLPDVGPLEVLAALHPGGSVTGAPKHAAMELIAALEGSPRGAYCGALGVCAEERATFSLLIRTASRCSTGWVYGVGGAIVWDSEPAKEIEEIHLKLGALR